MSIPSRVRAFASRSATRVAPALDDLLERCARATSSAPLRLANSPSPSVVVALSGGVDSAVAAWALKTLGFDVSAVFMRNWDGDEERASDCAYVEDRKSARACAEAIKIAFDEVNFTKRYWNDVFVPYVDAFTTGATPNPDLECNREVKFGALLTHVTEFVKAEYLATGHYARVRRTDDGDGQCKVQLLRGRDEEKDQSYFLASTRGAALARCLFPLGEALKSDVRDAARALNLASAERRSSAGICFIGRRSFGEFIGEYVESRRGEFIDVETMRAVPNAAAHLGLASYTVGQRAKIAGASQPWFVVGKNVAANVVYVASGREHDALYSTSAALTDAFWIAGRAPDGVAAPRGAALRAKTRYAAPLCDVTLHVCDAETDVEAHHRVEPSAFSAAYASRVDRAMFRATFANPERAITPGQALVVYDGDVCLGGGIVQSTSKTLFEMKRRAS